MAIEVPDIASVASKWLQRAQQSSAYYAEGTRGKGGLWEANARAAADTYAQGVQAAIGMGSFERGIATAGATAYDRGVAQKGTQRWAPGVAAGQDKYSSKMSAVLGVISGVTLPPRGPRGDAGNYERVRAVGEALHEARAAGRL